MVCQVQSDMYVTETGIKFLSGDGITTIPYRQVVWVYPQKRSGKSSQYYDLTDVTDTLRGDLVVVDEKRDTYIFLENFQKVAAGKKLIEFLTYDVTCFAGYDSMCERLYQKDFKQMTKARRMMWDIWNAPEK